GDQNGCRNQKGNCADEKPGPGRHKDPSAIHYFLRRPECRGLLSLSIVRYCTIENPTNLGSIMWHTDPTKGGSNPMTDRKTTHFGYEEVAMEDKAERVAGVFHSVA